MSQVINGETDRMAILYERYKMQVYFYFFRVTCGDRETSEDLVHTVFYRVLRYRSSFTGHGNFASWLFRIVHNVALDWNRRKKNSFISEYEMGARAVQSIISDENEFEKREQIASLRVAMKKLEHEEREIIILGKIECLRYREIADMLGTTEGNVKIRMFRALRRLKEIFMKIENARYEKERS
ncbi:MAG: RNA polymerase sigma factor [Bacteroidota bacterium]|nr:RNA polymerase sigma factor [Bacteroidota bacterium]